MTRRDEGYSFVELLITIGISGLIFAVVGGIIYQLTAVSGYGNDRLTTGHELQNAAHWFNLDGQAAAEATGGPSLSLRLSDDREVTYSLNSKSLERNCGGTTVTLARNIAEINFRVEGRMISMEIATEDPGRYEVSEHKVYQVYMRPRTE